MMLFLVIVMVFHVVTGMHQYAQDVDIKRQNITDNNMYEYYGFWPLVGIGIIASIPGGIAYYLTKKITKKDIPSEIVGVVVGFAVFMGIALYCRE